jgi:hypothetical protein
LPTYILFSGNPENKISPYMDNLVKKGTEKNEVI